jgi:hypothetical protein
MRASLARAMRTVDLDANEIEVPDAFYEQFLQEIAQPVPAQTRVEEIGEGLGVQSSHDSVQIEELLRSLSSSGRLVCQLL